jgi:hypothetical protein
LGDKLTHLEFGKTFNLPINNLPPNIKNIKINDDSKLQYLKKIAFGCKIIDKDDIEIFIE